ncbi:fatty acid kinase binding subunit FakB1 [Staphylococcus sp. SQ8-PEA]|uniref:Fatty acid kinase binding subunit FakB1 n=1 Tax=Staphylococcus marylandisciuri TaxID=2981529 RepID=A0ABT2QPC8_9STAP|nr:fatty acid kinase binding subunit FakB1 [Staphylococcus marylandisciuri]MCU5745833.1 fatty acid kinase binding subunit FakB1 [Staphylococcus marylandisciuri]
MKIAVLSDSTSYLPQEIINKYQIEIAPLSVTFENGENYIENETLFAPEFYQRMHAEKTIPTTSQPAIGEFIKRYEKLREEGYTDVIAIFISSGISGCYQTATQAAEMVDGINVYAFDTKLAAMVEGGYILRAIEMIEGGYRPAEIIDELCAMREDTGAFLMVDDLKNLQKSGRITGAQAWLGTLLRMKPVLKFEDGLIVPEEKVRTKKRALKTVVKKVLDRVKDYEELTLFVISGDVEEDGKWIYKQAKKERPDAHIIYSNFGPVIAAHLGSGGIGFGYTARKIKDN